MSGLSADLSRLLGQAQLTWRAPSVTAAVWRDGETLWTEAVGSAHIGSGSVGAQDGGVEVAYRIGSITKTFTAVLIHQLHDAGLLDLDDPLATHLPGTRHGAVTLRRMLGHLSGLQREPVGDLWIELTVPTREELLAGFEQAEQVLPSRTTHHYSNLAYAILGEVVARVTGLTWEQALQERLLDPLGLDRTGVAPIGARATGYLSEPYADAVRPEPDMPTGAAGPAMQLWSTAADLVRWAAFLADPPAALLSEDALDRLRQPVVVFDPHAFTLAWSAGLMLARKGERVFHGHGGAMPGFLAGCYAYRSETERIGAVVLTNTGRVADADGLAMDLLGAVLDAEPRQAPAWTPGEVPGDVRPLLGPWWGEGSENLLEWREGGLTAIGRGGAEWRRTRLERDGDGWRAVAGRERGERMRVVHGADGAPERLVFAGYAWTRDPRTFSELA